MTNEANEKKTGAHIQPANAKSIADAAGRICDGKLVAFPTETVYGLGANALDADAVRAIFTTKGRPATNPLIVHVPDLESAKRYAREWPALADALAARFWPGALTLVVRRADGIPDIVTAGGDTVGLRVPNHGTALELLRQSGVPIAAPSANRSEEVSPTTARHVLDSLAPFANDLLILDGGPCAVGLESTVLDITEDPPRLLRPGSAISRADLRAVLPDIDFRPVTHWSGIMRAPGQMPRHYAPKIPLVFVNQRTVLPGDVLLTIGRDETLYTRVRKVEMPTDPQDYAACLYSVLRELENESGLSRITVHRPPPTPEWAAVNDRLHRAAVPEGEEPKPVETRYNQEHE